MSENRSSLKPILRRLSTFEEVGKEQWDELVERSKGPSVFQTFGWLNSWWETFKEPRWELLLIAAINNDRLVGLAPFYLDFTVSSVRKKNRHIKFIGEGHGDYLTLIIDCKMEDLIALYVEEILRYTKSIAQAVLGEISGETEFGRYLYKESMRFTSRIECVGKTICPRFSLLDASYVNAILRKDSLRRHTAKLRKLGQITVEHHLEAVDINPLLSHFFEQHIARWSKTRYPSLFLNSRNCTFYQNFILALAENQRIIFTVLKLDNYPVAYHLGLVSYGDFLWYKPSFDISLSQVSPGEVMLRELFLMALSRQFNNFDFTRGDEGFKRRFASEYPINLSFVVHQSVISKMLSYLTKILKTLIKKGISKYRLHNLLIKISN